MALSRSRILASWQLSAIVHGALAGTSRSQTRTDSLITMQGLRLRAREMHGGTPYTAEAYAGYESGPDQGRYMAGEAFEARIVLDADHNGDAQWSLCPHSEDEIEECFQRHALTEWTDVHAYWGGDSTRDHWKDGAAFPQTVMLPTNVPRGPATLRWTWICKWTDEIFVSCIDVEIGGEPASPTSLPLTTHHVVAGVAIFHTSKGKRPGLPLDRPASSHGADAGTLRWRLGPQSTTNPRRTSTSIGTLTRAASVRRAPTVRQSAEVPTSCRSSLLEAGSASASAPPGIRGVLAPLAREMRLQKAWSALCKAALMACARKPAHGTACPWGATEPAQPHPRPRPHRQRRLRRRSRHRRPNRRQSQRPRRSTRSAVGAGPTCCAAGLECIVESRWHSQCERTEEAGPCANQ